MYAGITSQAKIIIDKITHVSLAIDLAMDLKHFLIKSILLKYYSRSIKAISNSKINLKNFTIF